MNRPLRPPPSVFHLRRWAVDPAADGLVREEATFGLRRELPLGDREISVGVAHIPAGLGEIAIQTADEFLHVFEGELRLIVDGATVRVGPGQSAMVPAGASLTWQANRTARAIYMRHPDWPSGEPARLIDPGLPRAPSAPPLAELLTTPTPSCRNRTQFRSADQTFTCGVWDSTPYARKAMTYAHHELMHLLDGEVTFEDELGATATFAAGDVFLVRRGARCSWNSPVPVTKVFAIHLPA